MNTEKTLKYQFQDDTQANYAIVCDAVTREEIVAYSYPSKFIIYMCSSQIEIRVCFTKIFY